MKLLNLVFAALVISLCVLADSAAVSYARLSIEVSVSEDSIEVGDTITINIALQNSGVGAKVATNPVVTVQMPAGSSDYSSADCLPVAPTTLQCTLAEISVDEVVNIVVSAVVNNAGHYAIQASVDADDLLGGPTSDGELIAVLTQSLNTDAVDLGVAVSANGSNEIKIEGAGYVSAVVRNSHSSNTVYFPIVELAMSEGLEFIAGDNCISVDGVVTCKVPTLTPQAEYEFLIELSGNAIVDEATLSVAASSNQPEIQQQDNTAELILSIVEWEILCGASNPSCLGAEENPNEMQTGVDLTNGETTEPVSAAGNGGESTADSGGGAMALQWFLLLLYLRTVRVRKNRSAS